MDCVDFDALEEAARAKLPADALGGVVDAIGGKAEVYEPGDWQRRGRAGGARSSAR